MYSIFSVPHVVPGILFYLHMYDPQESSLLKLSCQCEQITLNTLQFLVAIAVRAQIVTAYYN